MDKEFLDNKTETSGCTLEEYIYVYPRLMNKHITTGVPGRNELQFIRREIENHTIILEGLKKTMLKISDFDYRRENFDPIEENFGQEKFLNTMASYENMRDNHELIIEYLEFKKSALENDLSPSPKQPEPINLTDTSIVEKTSFINNFDAVQESKIIEYFTQNLVNKKYITTDLLNEYLKIAFEKKEKPRKRFSFDKNPTQQQVKKVFYDYYKIIAGKPYGKQKQYVELLGDYFSGFDTESIMTNFSK